MALLLRKFINMAFLLRKLINMHSTQAFYDLLQSTLAPEIKSAWCWCIDIAISMFYNDDNVDGDVNVNHPPPPADLSVCIWAELADAWSPY